MSLVINKQYIITITLSVLALAGCLCSSMPEHFNDSAIEQDKNSPDIIPYLGLKPGDAAADLGAGGGYYSVKLSRAVGPKGRVYAVDISDKSIKFIQAYAKQAGAANVETITATFTDSNIPADSVDVVLIRNAYHDFSSRVEYFSRLKNVFKKGGRIAVIDYDPAKLGFIRRIFGHSIEEKNIIEEMKKAGYIHIKSHPFLKEQSFNIFSPE